jgi:Flp pilus assembly protein protease CpaA
MAIITVICRRLSMEFLRRARVNFQYAMLVLLTFGRAHARSVHASTALDRQGVPWGVGIGLGTVAAYYLDPAGRWAGF